ncbi:hypothetical protein [Aeropyrum camini]|uniref:hypothetical protein n=1 Tax=Aeropyrum camini TaxID=229980 RepID=UPI000786CCCB|nr:hypothetical protein [Aeropyrum camini]
MARSYTDSVVLDTSVVAKSILVPPRYLRRDIYEREIRTRDEIRVILRLLEERNYKVFFPKAGTIEVASVLKRSGLSREQVLEVLESLNKTFIIIDENIIYDKALEVALTTAPSGFDTYFLTCTPHRLPTHNRRQRHGRPSQKTKNKLDLCKRGNHRGNSIKITQ